MKIIIEDENRLLPDGADAYITSAAEAALKFEGVGSAALTVRIVTDEEIRALNRDMRGVDKVTDVLSFPEINYPKDKTLSNCPNRLKKAYDAYLNEYYLGDVALNIKRAYEQARDFGHGVERETAYLTAHACLHLCGYDHMEDKDKIKMRGAEKTIMKNLGIFRLGGEDINMFIKEYADKAIEALDFSYSPYSKFRVGACLLSEDGEVFTGANFENASYGAAICAERCAVSNALMKGKRRFTKIYIACDEGYAWPCGICRQVLNEFKAGDMEVWAGSPSSEWKMMKLSELLPMGFGPNELGIK